MPREIEVEVKQLLFDPQNPRLPELLDKSQPEIFRFLVASIGIQDVLQSIAASGMIAGDPIIAREDDGNARAQSEDDKKYYVIEGNRRLAALKLLNGEKIGDGGEEPTIPEIVQVARDSIKGKITIQLGWKAPEIDAYLGYKHVTGTSQWLPEAKARFVIARVRPSFLPEKLASFAKSLGTTTPTLRRWIVAYLTLKQAESAGLFDPQQAPGKRYFGTFYTLLGSQQVQAFLQLKSDPVTDSPVPQDYLSNLGDFIKWTIGTTQVPPVVNSRKQKQLDAVLASPSALQYFRLKHELDAALLYTEYNADEVRLKLLNSAYLMEETLQKLFDVREQPGVVEAVRAVDIAYEKLKINARGTKTP